MDAEEVTAQVFLRNGPLCLEVSDQAFAIFQASHTGRRIRNVHVVYRIAERVLFPARAACFRFPCKCGGVLGGAAGAKKGGGK